MFRRSGKNPLEKESAAPLYPEESSLASYKYGAKKHDLPPQTEFSQTLFNHAPGHVEKSTEEKRISPLPHHFQSSGKDEPETTLGEGVTFRGELTFERLLRIDGTFEGELISKGKVIVGPKGKVKADLSLQEAIVEGSVVGNITVEDRLELRGEASVTGDITAKSLSCDEGVTIIGYVNVSSKLDA